MRIFFFFARLSDPIFQPKSTVRSASDIIAYPCSQDLHNQISLAKTRRPSCSTCSVSSCFWLVGMLIVSAKPLSLLLAGVVFHSH